MPDNSFKGDGVTPIDRSNLTLADKVEARLRDQIVQGERPTGSRLNEVEIASDLGVSRGPVRQALQRLAHLGLVTLESHRGAFVRSLDLGEVRELFELRIALECEAAELAAMRIDRTGLADLARLQDQSTSEVRQSRRPGVFDTLDLHHLIVRHAGNDRLAQAVTQVNVELRLARSRSGATVRRAQEAVEEHRELITYLTSRDAEGARVAMKSHLTASLHNTMQMLQAVDPNTPKGTTHG
ncbi:GntR family transcriptional regulator [Aeromicrobium yanjiei]|uniref:FCD domain-containing protein n=1 Tax=Aeromicrobium yanjiei TaxID=2662028 RepID=A0A5Q2MR45_9ACTN|nr:GntR family transcriptional regulator [Aeromicrobium yanjiei]QGG42950.1 FCD domain-containing protein [Aeromicrobium yanjiei]